ncbi:hypothetical protein HOF92_03460 [bacterium]|nr:hypothetical protein [bacterium]
MILKPNSSENSDTTLHLGYLYFLFIAQESVIGGCLIVDRDGFPQDFRYSLATHPEPLQKALYGQCLQPYLIESMTTSLVSELVCTPSLFLTNYRYSYSPESMPFPIFYLDLSDPEQRKTLALNEMPLEPPAANYTDEIKFSSEEPFARLEEALTLLREDKSES